MYIKISTILLALTAVMASGCSRTKAETTAVENVESNDSLPAGIKKLVRAIADDDSVGFAQLVSYPLQRPYPLHDIDDESQMRSYYKEMVDDSLRNIVTHAQPDRWSEYGWRGWSLDDGRYVWVDDASVYDMQYVSQRERRMIDSLTKEEVKSIAPSIREGWKPVMCLLNESNGNVYRVDVKMHKHEDGAEHYRMAIYEMPTDLKGLPSRLLDGTLETEGSQGIEIYTFQDHHGDTLMLEPEAADSDKPILIAANDSTVQLKRAYWHELVKHSK